MFDRNHHHFHHSTPVAVGPSRVDVHEHRAPTDESARLLSELEQKALDRVIHSQVIEVNGFKGSVTHMIAPFSGGVLYVTFKLNDEQYNIEIELEQRIALSQKNYAQYMVDKVSRAIAIELLASSKDVHDTLDARLR